MSNGYFGDNAALAKKRMSGPNYTALHERRAARMIARGPWLETSLRTKQTFLVVPQPRYSKDVWTFWQKAGGKWFKSEFYPWFQWDVTDKANQQAWLDRATAKFNEFWKGKVDG